MSTFAERLKGLRVNQGMTGSELGRVFNLTKSGISSYERRGSFPDESMLKIMAEYFGCSVDYLVGVSDEKNPIVSKETKSFTVKLVQQLIDENVITDPDNIGPEIADMILAALRNDIKTKVKK